MLSIRSYLFLLAAAALSSCAKNQEPIPAPVYLLDQRWVLVQLEGQQPAAPAGSPTPDLVLSSVEGTTSGYAFCNRYSGRYILMPGTTQLIFSAQGSTYATCARQEQESRYLQLLPSITHYTISNRRLQLYDATHPAPLLEFEATR